MLVGFLFMSNFSRLLTESNLLPSDNLQEFPTNFTMTLIKTLEIGSDVCNNFGRLIFLYKVKSRQHVKNLRDKVLDVDFFLVHDKIFNHFFNRAFVGCLLLVDEFVKNVCEKLSSKQLTFNGCILSLNEKLFILDLCLRLLSAFVFKEFSDHASESDENRMILRNSHDKTKTLEKEDHLKGFFVLLEDAGGLMNEVSHIKNSFMMIIEEFDELLDESADFLSGIDGVYLIHLIDGVWLAVKRCFPRRR